MNPYAVNLLSPLHDFVWERRPSYIEGSFEYAVWQSAWSDLSVEVGFTKLWSQNPRGRGHLCGPGTGRGIILKWI